MKYQLNLTALSCPIPLLTAKKALANLATNDELVLQLNRQSAVENFVVFCEENQCELVDQHWLSEQIFEVCLKKINLILKFSLLLSSSAFTECRFYGILAHFLTFSFIRKTQWKHKAQCPRYLFS